ncbi:MAG: C25 family cysteine peptidase [Acidobacteriota bacterium]
MRPPDEPSNAPKNVRKNSAALKRRAGFFLAAAFCTAVMSTAARAQVPILYYDFENNTTRTTFENLVEQAVNSGSGAITRAGNTTTISAVGGAGTFNLGAAVGQAATGNSWDSSTIDPGAAATNYYQFVVNTGGFSQISITFDNQASGTGPARVGVLYSTDGTNFTATATTLTGNNVFSAATFDLSSIPAIDNQSSVTIRLYAFAGSAGDRTGRSAFGSGGTFRIDNLTVLAKTVTASKTLLDYPAVGLSVKSGTAFTPTYVDFTVNGVAITVALASELKVSGTFTVFNGTLNCGTNVVSGSGTFALASGGTLGIGSTAGITSSGATGNIQTAIRNFDTGASYNYNGSAAQVTGNGLPVTVNDLAINNSAGVSLSSDVNVSGALALTSGTFTVGARTLILNNPIAGTPNNLSADSASSITIAGSSSGINIPSSVSALNNLTLNNSSGTTLQGNLTVSGVLALTSGDVTTGSFTLFMGNGATSDPASTGDVVGNVNRSDLGGMTTRSFGNPNVQITVSAGSVTAMTVNLVKASPSDFTNSVNRTYTLQDVVGTLVTATVRLRYLDSELNGNPEATLELWRKDGSAWGSQGADTRDSTNNWVEKALITGFSAWTIAGPAGPTDIAMVGYSANHGRDGKVLLQWETGEEVNNLGFNIYREEDGRRVRVNKSLIVGSGLMAKPGTVMTAGRSYLWQTSAPKDKDSVYWIEEIDLSGRTEWHGPVYSQAPADGTMMTMSAREQAIADQTVTLEDLVTEGAQSGATVPVQSADRRLKVTAANTNLQLGLASQAAVKITVKQEGWYRIGKPELLLAGLDPKADPRSLQLYADGVESPITVTTNHGKFDSTSGIEFYAVGLDTAETDQRVYWLISAKTAGKRIATVPGQGGLPSANSFLSTVERRDRSIYLSGIHNGDAENFFGTPVGNTAVDQTITLQHVDAAAAGLATIEVGMQGFSVTPHNVSVSLNGNPIGTIQYNTQTQGVAQFTVPNNLLMEGQNTLTLVGQQGVLDVSLVDHIRVSYWHTYSADGNALKFTATANQQVKIGGFTTGDVKVFDVTNPSEPLQLAATVDQQDSGYAVTVEVVGNGNRTLVAIGADQVRSPLRLEANQPSTLRSSGNQADLMIITHGGLKDSFAQLAALRQSQGLKVAMVDVQDIYDEFNFGNKRSQAVKDFLSYARSNWARPPRYVLLAGSASYDPKNYNGLGGYDLVPTRMVDTQFMETASDDWFADFNLDGIAEMAVGRLPAHTPEEAASTVAKLVSYEATTPQKSALLVADENLGFNFEAANNKLAPLFPAAITVQQINRGQIGTGAARQQLLDGLASGQKIVNYVGHGSPSVWRGNLLTAADALALTNTGRYPLFVAMTCLNGEFQRPELNTLAAALLNAPRGGAIAVWASSGFTEPNGQAAMNQQFYKLLFQPGSQKSGAQALTLGEATVKAKSSVTDSDIRRTWILFGDPSMKLK